MRRSPTQPRLRVQTQRDDSQRRFLSQHSVAMLEQCWNYSKQCRTNAATLCSAKNRRCESSRVTLPLNLFRDKCYCILTSIFRCMRLSEGFKVLMDNFCTTFYLRNNISRSHFNLHRSSFWYSIT